MKKFYLLSVFCAQVVCAQVPNNTIPQFLDKNMVKTRIYTVNNKFWQIYGNHMNSYEVPKGKNTHAQFCNSIWIGGFDHQGQLHMSANTYRQLGTDFWPGPLDTTNINAYTTTNTAVYNKVWKVDCNDINAFATAYNNGSVTANTYTVPPDMVNYPAVGIGNFQRNMEPFYDANQDGVYNSWDGDYPIIKGQQQILTIYNDNFTTHTETQAPPMGLEIHERAYAYRDSTLPDSMQAVNYSTFHYYTIYNRSNNNYSNVYIADWSDVDLGYFMDDYIGTDTINNFAYCYNADNFDQNGLGVTGYGNKPPVVSHAILKTPCTNDHIDNDGDGQIDEPGEQFWLNRSTYYVNSTGTYTPAMSHPDSAIQYYRYISGKWKDGSPTTYGGTGYGGTTPTKYVFPGNPINNSGWTEGSANIPLGDARVIYGSGPFDFPANSKIEWGYAIVFSQDTTQPINTITKFDKLVQRDVNMVRYYDQMHQTPMCRPGIAMGISKNDLFSQVLIYPNPARDKVMIRLPENISQASVKLLDVSGRTMRNGTASGNAETSFDIHDLANGIYFVEVSQGNIRTTKKLVKDR